MVRVVPGCSTGGVVGDRVDVVRGFVGARGMC